MVLAQGLSRGCCQAMSWGYKHLLVQLDSENMLPSSLTKPTGRPHFLMGHWWETLVPCHEGLSRGLLITWQLASSRVKDLRARERARNGSHSLVQCGSRLDKGVHTKRWGTLKA